MTAPTYKGKGTNATGTTSCSVPVPTGGAAPAPGDLLLIVCESSDSTTAAGTPNTPDGWTKIHEATEGDGAAGVTTLTIFAKRAGSSESAVTVDGVGDHIIATMFCVSGVAQKVNPWVVGDGRGGIGSPITTSGLATSVDDCLVFACIGASLDLTGGAFGTWTNTSLTGFTEREDVFTSTGAGGGIGVATGVAANAGLTANSSTTAGGFAVILWRSVHIAILPEEIVPWSWDLQAFIDGSWTSISEDVLLRRQSITASRGLDGSDVVTRVASPGFLSCLLDNGESNSAGLLGYYSPGHINMRANFGKDTLIRLAFGWDGGTYYKWRGYITDLEPTPDRFGERQSALMATDYMQRLSEHKLKGIPVQEDKRSDQVISTILSNMPISPASSSISTDKFILPYALHSEQDERTTAMAAVQKVCQTVLAYAFVRGNTTNGETFVFQREEERAATQVAATLDNTMSGVRVNRSTDRIHNRITGQIHPIRVDKKAETLLAYLENEIPIDGGGTLTITLRFRDPANLATRVSAKDIVTSLAANTHYRMSSKSGDDGNDLNSSLNVTVTAGGNTAIVQLQNTTGTRGYINKLEIFGKGIYLYSPVEIVVESGNSNRALNYDFYYLSDPYRARSFLQRIHDRASSEEPDVDNVWFLADQSAELMDAAMNLDIGDRVALVEEATGIVGEYIINKVTYTIQTNRTLRVDWLLERADMHNYFILDQSLLDGDDVLSPY